MKVHTISPAQAIRCIALGVASKVATILVGSVGCGKTTAPRDYVKKMQTKVPEAKLWMLPVGQVSDTSDITGVPMPVKDEKRIEYFPNGNIPCGGNRKGILVGDEIDRCESYVQNAFLPILLDHTIHGQPIDPDVYVMATMNGASDAYTTPLSNAARTRVSSLFVSRKSDDFQLSYEKWSRLNGISDVARTFARFRSELFEPEHEFEEIAQCVSRTVDMADMILSASKTVKFKTDDILLPMIAGVIGCKSAVEFLATDKLIAEAPAIDDVIANPLTAKIPTNPSVIYALTSGLIHACGNHETAQAVVKYGIRLPDEYTATLLNRLGKEMPSIVTDDSYRNWMDANQSIL